MPATPAEGQRPRASNATDSDPAALENTRHRAEAARHQRAAEELARIAHLANETLDPTTVGERIAESVLTLLDVHSSAIRLFGPDGALRAIALGGRARAYAAAGDAVPIGIGLVGRAAVEGRPMWTEDIRIDTRFDLTPEIRARNAAAEIVSGLAVPLRVAGEVIGVLSVGSPAPRRFADEDIALLQTFADQAVLALNTARLFAEADRRRREAEVLADVVRGINEALKPDVVLQRVAEAARELCGSDVARIALRDRATGAMAIRYSVGTRYQGYETLRIERGLGVGGTVWESGRPLRTDDWNVDPHVSRDYLEVVRQEGLVASLVVPIRGGAEVEGLITVDNRSARSFTDRDEAILMRLADHAAIAIHNAQTQDALARHAERLRILHEIDRALITEQSPAAIAEAVLARLRDLLGVPRAIVNVFDLAAGDVEWLAAVGRRRVYRGPPVRYPLYLAGDVEGLQRGEAQVIDVQALPPSRETEALRASGVHTYVVVPMITRGELIGSVSVGADAKGLPEEHIAIVREVATQMAIAIEQARLYERVSRQAEELEVRVQERTRELSAANAELGQEIGERRRAEAEADRANLAKSEFLSRMSHELRTPLNAILGFAQLLEMDAVSGEQTESVEHILRAGRHLLGLINEVLEISRIETGRFQMSLEPVPVAETLRQAIDLIQPSAIGSHVSVRVDVIDERLHVMADRQRLQQVLLNLLSNAVKYNREGGRVVASCREMTEGRLRILVTDTGSGIPADKQRRLFTPFDRLGAEASGVEGTGLGLALSKALTEAMGGTIRVESAPAAGSTFSVELPGVAGPAERQEVPAAVNRRLAERDPQRPPRRILYIEDNLSNLRLIESVLGRRPGMTVLSAMQGQVGLDLARAHQPDLILLDRHLPDIPGDEVFRLLRDDPRTRHIPVIVLSADAIPDAMRRLLDAGVRAYLTKPLDVHRFLAVVDEALRAEDP